MFPDAGQPAEGRYPHRAGPVQLLHQGRVCAESSVGFQDQRVRSRIFAIACMLLTHKERLVQWEQLHIDCAGDGMLRTPMVGSRSRRASSGAAGWGSTLLGMTLPVLTMAPCRVLSAVVPGSLGLLIFWSLGIVTPPNVKTFGRGISKFYKCLKILIIKNGLELMHGRLRVARRRTLIVVGGLLLALI